MILGISVSNTFTFTGRKLSPSSKMFKFVTYLLLAVATSSAEDFQSGYVRLGAKPNPQHCENLCLNTLEPLLNKISQRQDQGINYTSSKVQAKLDQLEVKMGEQLKDVRDKLEGQLGEIERNLQTTLKGQQAVLSKMETQLEALLKTMNFTQEADKVEKEAEEKPAEEKVPSMEDDIDFHAIFAEAKPAEEKVPPREDDIDFDAIFAKEKPAEEKVPPREDDIDFDAFLSKEKPTEEKVPPMEDVFDFDAYFASYRNT